MVIAQDVSLFFFTGLGLFFVGIMIWIFSAVWGIAGVAEEKTRDWLND